MAQRKTRTAKPLRQAGTPEEPRTRGGWVPSGTAAARRSDADERTAKGQRTADQLVAAARRVFEAKGFHDARVADIVEEAGVAHGSFYTYFPSKMEVFHAIAADVSGDMNDAVASGDPKARLGTYEGLCESNRRYLDSYRRNAKIWALIEQLSTFDPQMHQIRLRGRKRNVERVAKTIRRWQEHGIADAELDPYTTAGLLVSMLSNFAYWWLAGGDNYDEEIALQTVNEIWAKAVGLPAEMRAPVGASQATG